MAKAKKSKPERLPGAEQNCISPEQEAIVRWFRTVKFRKSLLGGVDEVSMWKKLEELYALYDAAIRAALYPEETNYYYYVARKNGWHYFASTIAQHEENIRRSAEEDASAPAESTTAVIG